VKRYLIFYRVTDQTIEVARILSEYRDSERAHYTIEENVPPSRRYILKKQQRHVKQKSSVQNKKLPINIFVVFDISAHYPASRKGDFFRPLFLASL